MIVKSCLDEQLFKETQVQKTADVRVEQKDDCLDIVYNDVSKKCIINKRKLMQSIMNTNISATPLV